MTPLFPLDDMKIFGFVLFFLFSIITTVAGIGGGVIYIPILMLMYNFKDKEAVPISISIVFITLLFRTILSIPERHPNFNKPIINYDIALLFSPSIVIGTIFGVLIHQVSPTYLILTFIILILCFNSYLTLKNAFKTIKNSKKIQEIQSEKSIYNPILNKILENSHKNINYGYSSDESKDLKKQLYPYDTDSTLTYQLNMSNHILNNNNAINLKKILDKEKKLLDYKNLFLMISNLIILILLNLLRGNKSNKSIINIEYCSISYWILEFIYLPFGLLFLFCIIKKLMRENKEKLESGYIFSTTSLHWDFHLCLKITINGIILGIISSMLGIGGAMVSAPLLLDLGLETQEASFTASFTAFFSSTATVIQYLINGKIKWDYAGICGIFTASGMIIGLLGIVKYLKKKKMLHVINFCLVAMILTAITLNFYLDLKEMLNDNDSINFHSIC